MIEVVGKVFLDVFGGGVRVALAVRVDVLHAGGVDGEVSEDFHVGAAVGEGAGAARGPGVGVQACAHAGVAQAQQQGALGVAHHTHAQVQVAPAGDDGVGARATAVGQLVGGDGYLVAVDAAAAAVVDGAGL